ncbi:MAG TPA: hypothetical protein V6D14_13220 [Coleofasciculaceae cyanobacterium]
MPEAVSDDEDLFTVCLGSDIEEQPTVSESKATVATLWSRRQNLGMTR